MTAHALTINTLRFARAVERIRRLPPRVIGELLTDAGANLDVIERYAALDRFPPEFLHAIGADLWPPTIFRVSTL